MNTTSTRGRAKGRFGALAIATAIGIGAVLFPAVADAKPRPIKPSKPTVMTRNLYLGADLTPAIVAPTPAAAYTAVGDIYKHVQDLNFNVRAKLLANEIEAKNPDLIGLQEVALWRRGQIGAPDGPATPATEIVYDYLELLTDELERRGLHYTPAVIQQEADLEFPADTHGATTDDAPDGVPDFDGRLTMRDVILVKDGIKVKDTGSDNYSSNAFVNTAAFGTVTVLRGYTWADVRIDRKRAKGTTFRFVNTHLESFSAYFRKAQAQELVGGSGVTAGDGPIVLVGDLNSDPDDPSVDSVGIPTDNNDAYEAVIAGGFTDLGLPSGTNTCCFGEDIRDAAPMFDSGSITSLARASWTGSAADLIGIDPDNRSGTNLWPTDHGGVVAQLKVG